MEATGKALDAVGMPGCKRLLHSLRLRWAVATAMKDALRARATGVGTFRSVLSCVPHPRPVPLVSEEYQLAPGVPIEGFAGLSAEVVALEHAAPREVVGIDPSAS